MVKGKVFQYSLPSVGPGADPCVQAVSPQVTWSESRHRPGSRLPLLSARHAVTSVAFTRWRYQHTSDSSLLLIYRPRKDERLSWPSWLTCSGRFRPTHISGHPSAAGRAQDRESSPVRDRRSTTVPRHQPPVYEVYKIQVFTFRIVYDDACHSVVVHKSFLITFTIVTEWIKSMCNVQSYYKN